MSAYRTMIFLVIFLVSPVALTVAWVRLWRERHSVPSSFFLAAAGLGLVLSLLALISFLWPGPQGGGMPQTWCGLVLGLTGLGCCCSCLVLGAITLPVLAIRRGKQALAVGKLPHEEGIGQPQGRDPVGAGGVPGEETLFRPADMLRSPDVLPTRDVLPPEEMFPPERTPNIPSLPEGWPSPRSVDHWSGTSPAV